MINLSERYTPAYASGIDLKSKHYELFCNYSETVRKEIVKETVGSLRGRLSMKDGINLIMFKKEIQIKA